MDGDLERVLAKERLRYRVLRALYDLSDGSRYARVLPSRLAEICELTLDEVDAALDYLDGEGLTKLESIAGTRSIQHRGVVEVERSIKRPDEETEHFSAVVIRAYAGPGAKDDGA